ncbi:MAG TPA: acyltransferase [Sphingomicrobium sp.]|nr:acyltransferase [Sphingomicrobium sp.]
MRSRFSTLDALRGIAAIGVMLTHSHDYNSRFPSGYLAVDLFFGLSGFVMALSYQERLRAGMGIGQFLTRRAARLWPMLLVGAALGVLLLNGSLGMVMLIPDWSSSGQLFPANGPLWSLLMEACAYVAFALVIARLGTGGLVALVVASGITLIAFAARQDANLVSFGNEWHAVPPGLARTAYAFSLGVLMFRLRAVQGMPKVTSARSWLLPVGLVYIMLLLPQVDRSASLCAMMLGVPLIVWWSTKWEVPNLRLASGLSDLSYPMYCIHLPILAVAGTHGVYAGVLWLPLIGLSLLLDRIWDRPMRHALRVLAESGRARPKAA